MDRKEARSFRITLDGYWCIYCGETATCLDHFPPLICNLHGFLLPACRECNAIAGTNWPYSFRERLRYVKKRLEVRHARELRIPEWFPHELSGLRGKLKKNVELWLEKQRIVNDRIAWSAEAYLAFIDLNNCFAETVAEIAGTPGNEQMLFEKRMKLLKNTGFQQCHD